MVSKIKKNKKSLFITKPIRKLTVEESIYVQETRQVLNLQIDKAIISHIPKYISYDNIARPLILSKDTVTKITRKHGNMDPVNLLINAHDWDIIIKNMDNTQEKICLLKHIPNSDNIFLIGAFRKNGFFVLSHYEVKVIETNQLKSLLGRGDVIRKDA
jgi:hypothetical protein